MSWVCFALLDCLGGVWIFGCCYLILIACLGWPLGWLDSVFFGFSLIVHLLWVRELTCFWVLFGFVRLVFVCWV